ncbi:hypothetical protein [Streptomyces sp. NPDC008150]|uniref:hypothetical protein n=1 Tax=Streptomyces sp. NPDC008150 TaxID=3364816 RepID=UPI0036E16758
MRLRSIARLDVGHFLHQPYWAMQSFAYDHVKAQMYFAQHRVGTSAGHNGDL